MYKQLPSGKLGIVLFGLLFLAGDCANASMLPVTLVSIIGPAVRDGDASAYKFTDAGIQFTVPAGWDVKTEKDSVKVFPKGHNAQIAFVALPIASDLNSDERESLFDTLSGKAGITELKLGDYADHEKIGGMRAAARRYEGKNNDHEVSGIFILLNAEKYIFIVLVVDKSAGSTFDKDVETVFKSLEKIE